MCQSESYCLVDDRSDDKDDKGHLNISQWLPSIRSRKLMEMEEADETVDEQWEDNGWTMSGQWMNNEWTMSEQWMNNEWTMSEQWMNNEWTMSEQWMNDSKQWTWLVETMSAPLDCFRQLMSWRGVYNWFLNHRSFRIIPKGLFSTCFSNHHFVEYSFVAIRVCSEWYATNKNTSVDFRQIIFHIYFAFYWLLLINYI